MNAHAPRRAIVPLASTVLTVVMFAAAAPTQQPAQQPAPKSATPGSAAPKPGIVKSKDGTPIAYEVSGMGPPMVLVAPALSDRTDARRLGALLAETFTVFNYDRRGRGDSGDGKAYAVEREIEDIAALIEAAGRPVFLFGSSSGAALALEASNRLTTKVAAAALFEPPYIVDDSRPPMADAFFDEIAALVAQDRRGDAVARFMTAVGVPEEMVAGMKQAPMWAGLERRAHTLPYDGAIVAGLQAGKPLPADRWTAVTARVLVIEGDQSPPWMRRAAKELALVLPTATLHTLAGQDHSAVFQAPQALVPVLTLLRKPAEPGPAKPGK
jgi:pimeloyl-ACP methyl ester carboxylesterase